MSRSSSHLRSLIRMSSTLGLAILGLGIPALSAELNIDQPAPDFTGTDSYGQRLA